MSAQEKNKPQSESVQELARRIYAYAARGGDSELKALALRLILASRGG